MTLAELKKIEKNYDIKIIQILNTLSPIRREIKIKINGVVMPGKLSAEFVQDLVHQTSIKAEYMIKGLAIDWYLNNTKIIRKLKLEKIKEKYES